MPEKTTIQKMDDAYKAPEFARDLYLFLANDGQIPIDKKLPPEKVGEFFGVQKK